MTRRPILSAVVPNYCYARFLDRFFSCLARQTFGLDGLEIIAVDDGSTDNSLEKFALWRERLACLRFDIVELEHTGSPAKVRNAGFSRAKGAFMVALDPDDEIAPRFFEACLCRLAEERNAAFAYTDWMIREKEMTREVKAPEYDPSIFRTQNPCPPTMIMRREVWESSRGFNPESGYEDWDFWVQAAANGHVGVRVPETLYLYDLRDDGFFSGARKDDARAKAALVMNNRKFFDPLVVSWAKGVMRGALWAGDFGRGLIPRPEDVIKLKEIAESVVKDEASSAFRGEGCNG